MKKLFLFPIQGIIFSILIGWNILSVYALDPSVKTQPNIHDIATKTDNEDRSSEVVVTELLPGMSLQSESEYKDASVWCVCIAEGDNGDGSCGTPATRKYKCKIPPWLDGFQAVVGSMLKYTIYIGLLLGVLALVALGVAWSVYWAFDTSDGGAMGKKIKGWLSQAVIALIVLFFFSTILRILAPWVYY